MRKLLVFIFFAVGAFAQEPGPKNVQLLTGLTPTQLQRNMNLMRAALGVHCDYCHVNSEEKGWQFALDEKETKRRARDMIRMVMDINAKHFGGQPIVTCNTCHNGQRRPAITVALPTPAPEFPTPIPDRTGFPAVKDVVAKYVAAVGEGPRGTTRVLKGTRIAWDGKSTPLEVYQDHDHVQMIWNAADGTTVTQTLTGDGGWVRDKDGVRPMRSSMVENLREIARMFDPWSPSSLSSDAKVLAKDAIDGHDVWVVGDGATRLSFDAANGLLLRRLVYRATPIGRRPEQTDFSDYRAVDKAKLPFVVRVSLVDPWVGSTRKADELHVGVPIDPARFAMP